MTKNSKMGGPAAKLRRFLRRGAADRNGAAAVFFAVALMVLAPLTLGLVDVYMATTQRGELLDALDTATLYVARSKETDAAKLNEMGLKVLKANLHLPSGQQIHSSSFVLVDNRKIVGDAQITPPSFSPKFWTQSNLKAHSEVTRNSVNLEVAIVLDTTGSMSGEMESLKTAAKDLVGLVVQDVQTPYYSKAAVIPYSVGVNVGTFADATRGATRAATAITKATKANPVVITSANHGLANDEAVYITGVSGMTQLNDKEYVVKNRTANTFELYSGANSVNGSNYGAYTKNGSAQCRGYGCPDQRITTADSVSRLFSVSACATERTGGDEYTDAPPSTRKVGFHYQATSNIGSNTTCKSKSIVPLTSTKKTLTDKIDTLTSDGSTAGHIGLAWGWYAISPRWNSVFTDTSAPAAYDKPETVKVVVLMTDGAFNTNYCRGVSSTNSFGETDDRIKGCNATNGTSYAQAASLCTNMRAKQIVLYTVGFNLGTDAATKKLLTDCASKPENVYMPSSGTALKDAFKAIAQDINRLRISK